MGSQQHTGNATYRFLLGIARYGKVDVLQDSVSLVENNTIYLFRTSDDLADFLIRKHQNEQHIAIMKSKRETEANINRSLPFPNLHLDAHIMVAFRPKVVESLITNLKTEFLQKYGLLPNIPQIIPYMQRVTGYTCLLMVDFNQ